MTATVVGAPAFGIASEGPDLALPDQVLDAEGFGVVLEPAGESQPVSSCWGVGRVPMPLPKVTSQARPRECSDLLPGRGE